MKKAAKEKKRKSFVGLFITRLLASLLIAVPICLLCAKLLIEYSRNEVFTDSLSRFNMQTKALSGDYENEEEREVRINFYLRAYLNAYYETEYDYASVLYDTESGEIAYSSEKLAFLFGGEEFEYQIYVCQKDESLNDFFAEIDRKETELAEKGKALEIKLCDVYLDGRKFIPGKAVLMSTDIGFDEEEPSYEEVGEIDAAPTGTEGMEHIEFSSDEYMLYIGTRKDSKLMQEAMETAENAEEEKVNYSEGWEMTGRGVKIEFASPVRIGGREYGLYSVMYQDLYSYAKKPIFMSCIGILIVSVIIALILSLRTYYIHKSHYAMEDYRREITNAMAHDLKSPLMAISGYAENLKENIHSEKREHYADSIIENVDYMNGIIMDVLELAKLESCGRTKKTDVELMPLTEEILKKYELRLEEKDITVEKEGGKTIKADKRLIGQALENLISNAVKYTYPEGGIRISVSNNEYTIQNDCAQLDGINADELMKPFVKGDNSRSDKQGSGIGLAIVKNIADLHGYDMKISAENGTFTVKIKFR